MGNWRQLHGGLGKNSREEGMARAKALKVTEPALLADKVVAEQEKERVFGDGSGWQAGQATQDLTGHSEESGFHSECHGKPAEGRSRA